MGHFEWNSDDELEDEIVGDVDEAFVQEGVGEEAPSFEPPTRIVDQRRVKRSRTREGELLHFNAVVQVKRNFDQAVSGERRGRGGKRER